MDKKLSLSTLAVLAGLAVVALETAADVSVKTPGQEVRISGASASVKSDGVRATATAGSTAGVTVGGIEDDADIIGVTVINGRVSIDGKEIPPNVTRYKSPRTGTVYLIQRKNGSVSVTSEEGERK